MEADFLPSASVIETVSPDESSAARAGLPSAVFTIAKPRERIFIVSTASKRAASESSFARKTGILRDGFAAAKRPSARDRARRARARDFSEDEIRRCKMSSKRICKFAIFDIGEFRRSKSSARSTPARASETRRETAFPISS